VTTSRTAEEAAIGLEPWTLGAPASATIAEGLAATAQPKVLRAALLELATRRVLLFEPQPRRRFHKRQTKVKLIGEADDPALRAVVRATEAFRITPPRSVVLRDFAQELARGYEGNKFVERHVVPGLEASGLVAHTPRRLLGLSFGSHLTFTEEGRKRRDELKRWLSALRLPSSGDPTAQRELLSRAGSAPLLLEQRRDLERWLTPAGSGGADGAGIIPAVGQPGGTQHDGSHGAQHLPQIDLGALHGLDASSLEHVVHAVHEVHHAVDAGHAGGHGGHDGGGGGHGGGGHG